MKEKVYKMDKVLREILRKSPYFEEINENRFVPEYLGLIVNGVVVYHVNWIDLVGNEIIFMHKDIQTHPIVSLVLENLNSLMIITSDGFDIFKHFSFLITGPYSSEGFLRSYVQKEHAVGCGKDERHNPVYNRIYDIRKIHHRQDIS